AIAVLHCLQENVFQRIALGVESSNLNLVFASDFVQIAYLDTVLQNELEPPFARKRVLASKTGDGLHKRSAIAARLDLQKLEICFSLVLKVAIDDDAPLLDDQNFLAALFDVSQQMLGKNDVSFA